jgi:hypothetical protein
VTGHGRQRAQVAVRVGGLVFVLAWLLSGSLQAAIPFWLPFAVLAATELEFLVRGLGDRRGYHRREAPRTALERRLPGTDDADLGWVEAEDEDGEIVLVPAPPSLRRRSRRLPVAIGMAVAVALFVIALRVDTRNTWSSLEPEARALAEQRFTREAREIAGRAVTVRCDDGYAFTGVGSDAAGVAFIPRGLAFLEPGVCRTLYDITEGGGLDNREEAAFAVTVLAHEATHLRGIRNEATTECYALQEGTTLGTRLGISPGEAHELMQSQLDRDLGNRSVERLGYRLPAECRNGGALDLRPEDATFP